MVELYVVLFTVKISLKSCIKESSRIRNFLGRYFGILGVILFSPTNHFLYTFFQVCPCTKRGCQTRSKCATVTWKTGANSSADVIPSAVVSVKEDSYNVSWTPPPFPNGIVLRYGVQTRYIF